MKQVFKSYLIEAYDEERLVGGPYENNEERQYHKTGKTLHRVTSTKKNQPQPGYAARELNSIKEAKQYIRDLTNTIRTKKLQTKHAKLREKFINVSRSIEQVERELRRLGAKFNEPDIYGKYR